jgi:teichoic acid transport system permease protein
VAGSRLILNTAFPRTLLPLESVITAFMRFLPTLLIYAPVHVITGLPVGPVLLWLVPIVMLLLLFSGGAAMFAAAGQVYFRDLSSFLPYATRIWMYGSPVLYYLDEVHRFRALLAVNPLTPLLASLSDVLEKGKPPSPGLLGLSVAWSGAVFLGGALFFLSRERDFAVRL